MPSHSSTVDPTPAHSEASSPVRRGEVWMVVGLLLIAVAAALRAAAAGTFRIDDIDLAFLPRQVVRFLLIGGLSALYGGHLMRWLAPYPAGTWSWRREIGLALLLQAVAALAIPVLCNDLFNYLLFGNLEAQRGISAATATPAAMLSDPFQRWIGDVWRTTPCPYGPLSIGHFAAVSWLGGGPVVPSLVVYKISMVVVSSAWVLLCAAGARRAADPREGRMAFWLLACSPLWLLEVPGQGHNDGMMAVLMLGAVLASRAGRPVIVTVALALATAVKFIALIPFAFVLLWELLQGPGPWHRRIGVVTLHAMIFTGVVALSYAPIWEGWQTITYPLSAASAPRFHASFLESVARATSWMSQPSARLAVGAATAAAWLALVGLTVHWVRGWRTRGADPQVPWETALRFLLVYLLIGKGFSMPWYQLWLLPLLAASTDRRLWTITILYSYLTGLYYLVPRIYPFDETIAVLPLIVQAPALVMMWRLSHGSAGLRARLSER